MAVRKVIRIVMVMGLLAGAVSGCNGLPFGGGDSSDDAAQDALTPAPSHHHKVANANAASPSPSPSPSSMVTYSSYLRRNVTFDSRRTLGMTQVYEGKTITAVGTFHEAQRMRPDDRTCQLWLAAIKQAAARPHDHALAPTQGTDEFHNAGPAPGMPQPPTVPTGAAPKPLSVDPRQVF